jgi:serine/threonine-protein kinase
LTVDRAARGGRAPATVGPWQLVELLGQGRLACVYSARPKSASAEQLPGYAIKLLRPEWQQDDRGLALLARELQVSRKVMHPHLMPILAAELNTPPYYLAMPNLDGRTLAQTLDKGPLDLPVALWIARQAAEALEALHAAGWTHGDVKPSNILLSTSGHATLIDLGFARTSLERCSLVDRPVLGTIQYMAPEQLSSTWMADIRSDVYSLGVTLFEMFVGRTPFGAEEVSELAVQHRQDLPGDLRSLVPHLPTRAARLVQHMLAKQPLRRPAPQEVVRRLTALEIDTFAERTSLSAAEAA